MSGILLYVQIFIDVESACEHSSFVSDSDLLGLEVLAWEADAGDGIVVGLLPGSCVVPCFLGESCHVELVWRGGSFQWLLWVGSCCTALRTFAICASQALLASVCTSWLILKSLSLEAPLAAIIVSHPRHRKLLTPLLLIIRHLYLHPQALKLLLHFCTLLYPLHLRLIFPFHLLLQLLHSLLLLHNLHLLLMLLLHILINHPFLVIYLLLLLFHLLPQCLVLLQNLLVLLFQQLDLLFQLKFIGFGSFNDVFIQVSSCWWLKHHYFEIVFGLLDLVI